MNPNDQDIERALKSLKKDTSSEWESSVLDHLQKMSEENVTDESNLRISLRDQHGPSIFYSFFNTPMKRLFTTFGTIAAVFVLALGLQAGFNGATPANSFAYSIDRSFERIELAVAKLGGKDSVAQKHLDHANERIEEIDSILENSGSNLLSFGSLFIQTAYAQDSTFDSFFDISVEVGPLIEDYEESLGKAADLIPVLKPEKAAKIIGELTSTVRGITRVVGEHSIKGSKFDLNPINEEVQQVILKIAEKTKNVSTGMVPHPGDQEEEDDSEDCFDDAGNEVDCPEDEEKDDDSECFDEAGNEIDCPDDEDKDDVEKKDDEEKDDEEKKDDDPECFDDAGNKIDCPEDEDGEVPVPTLEAELQEAVKTFEEEVKINEEILKKLAKGPLPGSQSEEGEDGLLPIDPFILEHLFAGPDIGRLGLDPNVPCSDTDGGQDKFVQGIVQRGDIISEDVCFHGGGQEIQTEIVAMDLSSGSNAANGIVQEYYCAKDNTIKTALYNCANGCSQGACQKAPTFDLSKAPVPGVVEVCVDTDGGGIGQEYIKGQATVGNSGGGDYCNPNGGLHLETMCENGEYATKVIQCPNGCTDDEGACKKPEATAESADPGSISVSPSNDGGANVVPAVNPSGPLEIGGCYDTDASQGANQIYTKGSVSDANFKNYGDACTGGVVLFEQTCVDGKVKLPADDYECEYGCEDGRCLSEPAVNPIIKEAIKVPSITPDEEVEGVIVPALAPDLNLLVSCNDTDGGKDYFTKGSTSDGETNLPDKCNGATLYEYYCENGSRKTSVYACPYGCDSGRCNEYIDSNDGRSSGDDNNDSVIIEPAAIPNIVNPEPIPDPEPEVQIVPIKIPQLNLTR